MRNEQDESIDTFRGLLYGVLTGLMFWAGAVLIFWNLRNESGVADGRVIVGAILVGVGMLMWLGPSGEGSKR